jgi:penicillin-binding protein 1C
MGLSTFTKNPAHYGLSLILGGGETTLFEITEAYRKMGAKLCETDAVDFPIEKGAIWLTTETLTALNRPETESGWYDHGSGTKIAWKTGTSFGFRDAWAIGFTPDFTIGVWAGNADGTGRPGLVGTTAAAPLLFDLAANLIKSDRWFEQPIANLERMDVCAESGFSVGLNCPVEQIIVPAHTAEKVSPCKYHHQIRTTADMAYRIPAACETGENSIVSTWFVLPPLMAHYYKQKQLSYRSLPPILPGCTGENGQMEIIFPPPDAAIYQPLDFNSDRKAVIFELTHTHQHATVFWHLDDTYVGATEGNLHQMPFVFNRSGNYRLSVTDMDGQSLYRSFNVQLRE